MCILQISLEKQSGIVLRNSRSGFPVQVRQVWERYESHGTNCRLPPASGNVPMALSLMKHPPGAHLAKTQANGFHRGRDPYFDPTNFEKLDELLG